VARFGGSSWQRRMTPVSLRGPKEPRCGLPGRTRWRRVWAAISERPIERRRHTDVNVLEASLGHGNFRIATMGWDTAGVGWRLFLPPRPGLLCVDCFPKAHEAHEKRARQAGVGKLKHATPAKFSERLLCARTHTAAPAQLIRANRVRLSVLKFTNLCRNSLSDTSPDEIVEPTAAP